MKCSICCKYYNVYAYSEGYKIVCDLHGFTIKDIRNRFPDMYKDCPNCKEVKGR